MRILLTLSVVLLCVSTMYGAKKPVIVKKTPMPMTAPLFLESETYTSTISLVNQLDFGLNADITLYDMSGALMTTKRIYLDPNTSQVISIRKVLSDSGLYSQAGSVEVVTPENESAVLGQLSISRNGKAKAYLDEELFMPDVAGSGTLSAVIDSPENSPIVAITNISSTISQQVHVACLQSLGTRVEKTISLQPKQTRLVKACNGASDLAFTPDAVDNQFVLNPETPGGMAGQGVAGITIATNGPAGELAAFGFVEHDDKFGKYFSAMNFADPGLLHSSATVFAGVPVGTSDFLKQGIYSSQVALTNFSSVPQKVSISFATTVNGTASLKVLSQLSLQPAQSGLVPLNDLIGDPTWQNSFIVESSGKPGDVLAKMMFKSPGPLPNIELIGKDEMDSHNAGDHPWSIADGMKSVLILFNHSQAERHITIRVASKGEAWFKLILLKPHESISLSLNDVILNAQLDSKGHALSKTLTTGEVAWWSASSTAPQVTGRVVQISSSGDMARNFSCGGEIGLCNEGLSIDPFELPFGQQGAQQTQEEYCSYSTGYPGTCTNNGQYGNMQVQMTRNWSIDNPNIIQLVSTSGNSAMWKALSVGGTIQRVTAYPTYNPNNSCSGSGPGDGNPTVTVTNYKNLALANGGAQSAGTSNQVTAVGSPSGGTYSWTSDNTNIRLSNQTSATVTTDAVTAGASNLKVTYTVSGYTASATNSIQVSRPTSLAVTSDTQVQLSHGCYSGANYYNGPARTVGYTIQTTQNGQTVPLTADVYMAETFRVLGSPPPSCGATPATSQFVINQTFPDNFNYCSTNCLPVRNSVPQGKCTLSLEHVWTANGFPVFDHTLTYTCQNITPQ